MAEGGSAGQHRTVDRLINFSDAVVAVAITLLALPLVDIAAPSEGHTVWQVLGNSAGQIYTFLFTFFVVVAVWTVHNRILNGLVRLDAPLVWLNTSWLAVIVLLPWFSSMYGEGEVFTDQAVSSSGVGMLYWATLAGATLLIFAMGRRIAARPDLCGPDDQPRADGRVAWRGPILAAYFLGIGIVSMVAPGLASWLPLGIIPLSMALRPGRSEPAPPAGESTDPLAR